MRSDEYYMWRVLALARRGQGHVSPNPMVGAVVVSPDGEILAKGYHRRYGDLHAERVALEKLGYRAKGCTLYVNLEPCCHYGKTPPCTEAILESGVKRVVVAVLDPNPQVSGRGVQILRDHGVEVTVGVLEKQARWLNRGFFKWIRTGRPYVILKWAQTLDGKIATDTGDSKWVSCSVSLRYAHRLRAESDAVLVGRQTALKDDPRLNVRLVKGKDPLRVVLDTDLTLPSNLKLFDGSVKTLVFTACQDQKRIKSLESDTVEVVRVSRKGDGLALDEVLDELGKRGITKLLVEGGGRVHASFVKEKLFDEVQAVVALKLLGSGVSCVGALGIERMAEAVKLRLVGCRKLGEDILLVGRSVED